MSDVILSLVEKYAGHLKKSANTDGGEYVGYCPFCRDGNNRFHVWPNSEYPHFWCRICGKRGGAVKFLMEKEGLTKEQAIAVMTEGMTVEDAQKFLATGPRKQRLREVTPAHIVGAPHQEWQIAGMTAWKEWHDILWSEAGAKALDYLRRARGLPDEVIEAAKFGFNPADRFDDPTEWGLAPDHKKVFLPKGIIIPYVGERQLWKIEIRRPFSQPGKKYATVSGSANVLYGYDDLKPGTKRFVCVEGAFDRWVLRMLLGADIAVVATGSTMGAHNDRDLMLLACCEQGLWNFDPDANGAGDSGSAWWLSRLPNVKRWRHPDGDPNTLHLNGVDIPTWIASGFALFESAHVDPTMPTSAASLATLGLTEEESDNVSPPPIALKKRLSARQCFMSHADCTEVSACRDLNGRRWCAKHAPTGAVQDDGSVVDTDNADERVHDLECYLCGSEVEMYDALGRAWCAAHAPALEESPPMPNAEPATESEAERPKPAPPGRVIVTFCAASKWKCGSLAVVMDPVGYGWCEQHRAGGEVISFGDVHGWPALTSLWIDGERRFAGIYQGQESWTEWVLTPDFASFVPYLDRLESLVGRRPLRETTEPSAPTESCNNKGCCGTVAVYDMLGNTWCENCADRAQLIDAGMEADPAFPRVEFSPSHFVEEGEEKWIAFARLMSNSAITLARRVLQKSVPSGSTS